MATNAPWTLELPRPAPPRARRLPSRLVAAVMVAVLALGLVAVRADGMPRTPASTLAGAASSLGRGAAAAAVGRLVAAPAGQRPLPAVPADFPAVMRYAPVPVRMADGIVRLAKPDGACSVPGGGTPFGFGRVCKVHDYGYDLLRYAHATGQVLTGEARRQLDGMLDHDLHAQCRATGHGIAGLGCDAVAEAFSAGVSFNSWRQHYGNPGKEPIPWVAGLLALALATPLLARRRRILAAARWRRRAAALGGVGRLRLALRRAGRRPGHAGPGGHRAGGGGHGRLRALADATPASRDRYVDFLRVASIVTVVLGHWTMTAMGRSGHGLTAGNVLSSTPGLWLATWVLQVMPVFFVVGGFSNMVSWEALRRRGGGYVEYLSGRMARLLRPVLAFAAAWLLLPLVLGGLGVPAEQVELVGKVMGQPLWFLGVYLVVVALAPAMVRLHRRHRLRVPLALAAAAAAVDALRHASGSDQVGYVNLLLVWVLVQQVGFFYADGTLTRLSRRALAGVAAAGLGGMVVLTGTGLYPPSMVGLPGEPSNMSPPTICIVALTVWQVALLMLARGRVSAWLARRRPWTAVIAVGSMAMTLYLWHITAMVALYGLVLALHGPLPSPGGALWWATRPLWLALLAAALVPMALLLSRFERPGRRERSAAVARRPAETPAGRLAAVLGLVLATLGLLGFVASGFTPLFPAAGGRLLVLHVGPLQNLVYLVVGAYLAGAARRGAVARPLPWLLAAAGTALPLLLAPADPTGVGLHLALTALALAVAATRRPWATSAPVTAPPATVAWHADGSERGRSSWERRSGAA
ncbi:MAG TPA: acyltransferase family protein [Actinomycetes bacterium]